MEKKEDYLVEHYQALLDIKNDFRNANLFNLIARNVHGTSVVDIGCGSGFFASLLTQKNKHVIGIEPNAHMRELAMKINPEVTVLAGGAEDIDVLITKPVDTVVMLDVLEHVEHDGEQVEKIKNILTEQGEFIVVVPACPFLYGERDKGMHHYRRYTKKSLRTVLIQNGFEITKIRHWNMLGFFPYLLSEKLFRKPLTSKLRGNAKVGLLGRLLRSSLNIWFRVIENTFDFRFGLSIIAVARKR
jgi:2-polyprenyl-3-methyl-5-hydroxy-6-metoxy-1,4-benzoquinol methylase